MQRVILVPIIALVVVVIVASGAYFIFQDKEADFQVPATQKQQLGYNPFTDSSEDAINCIIEAIGQANYQEITKDKPRRPTDEEIRASDRCAEQFQTASTPQETAEQEVAEENTNEARSQDPSTPTPAESTKPADPRYTPPKTYAKIVRNTEPLVLEGNEKLIIEDTHWIQANDIRLHDNAQLTVRNALLDLEGEYYMQYTAEVYDNSKVVFENIELRNSCGTGLGWIFTDSSFFEASNVHQKGCNIWVLTTAFANSSINQWDWFGGTTCDEASIVVEDSKNLEIELCNTPGVDIDIDLPVVINEYEFSGRTVPGMKNSIILRNVTIEGWGPGAYYGTGITVRNGEAVTISFVLQSDYTGKTVILDGLGRKYYDDAIWEFDDGYIRLLNTTMYGWEPNSWGDNTLVIRNSNFTGPTINGGNSKIIVENSTFGTARAPENVEIEITGSVITVDITAQDKGKIVIRDSELAGVRQGDNFYPVRVTASDNGVVELIGTPVGSAILMEEGNGRIIQQ